MSLKIDIDGLETSTIIGSEYELQRAAQTLKSIIIEIKYKNVYEVLRMMLKKLNYSTIIKAVVYIMFYDRDTEFDPNAIEFVAHNE